jgi:hypothetical protein
MLAHSSKAHPTVACHVCWTCSLSNMSSWRSAQLMKGLIECWNDDCVGHCICFHPLRKSRSRANECSLHVRNRGAISSAMHSFDIPIGQVSWMLLQCSDSRTCRRQQHARFWSHSSLISPCLREMLFHSHPPTCTCAWRVVGTATATVHIHRRDCLP